jgi:hypothetical protein
MIRSFRVHFDGKVLVPETPVDLPQNQPLTVSVEPTGVHLETDWGTAGYLMKHLTSTISDEDADLMRRAIAQADLNFEPSPDINLD